MKATTASRSRRVTNAFCSPSCWCTPTRPCSTIPPPPTAVRSLHNLVPALRKLLGVATPARQDLRSPDARDIAEGRPSPADIVTLVRLVPDRRAHPPQARGFDLRDAAVGAAAATGLILLLAGSVLRLRRHRHELFSVVIQRSL